MNKDKNSFLIKKKLDAIEWRLELLRASMTNTHTPLRTIKSMLRADIKQLTKNLMPEMIGSPPQQIDDHSPEAVRENSAKRLVWQNRHL